MVPYAIKCSETASLDTAGRADDPNGSEPRPRLADEGHSPVRSTLDDEGEDLIRALLEATCPIKIQRMKGSSTTEQLI